MTPVKRGKEKNMSNWTHVAGIIRIDDFRMNDEIPDFEKIFGKTVRFDDPWFPEGETLPMGSEGSLKMSVCINPNPHELSAYAVSIFGDLRDHDNPEEIVNWFKEKCKKVNEEFCGVRNACIVVENEWNGTATWFSGGDS